jgi:retron-type reverse transcriptase
MVRPGITRQNRGIVRKGNWRLHQNSLYKIWNRMRSETYFPPPVSAVSIPKKSGGQRILGVPTVADRVAQMVVIFMSAFLVGKP